ncbi:MAG: T9SS type A sorting domain-containing protein, partial [Bacteroidales bacterium]
ETNGNLPDSLQLMSLYELSETSPSIAGIYARNILLSMDLLNFNEPIIVPDMTKSAKEIEFERLSNIAKGVKQLEIFPNPAKDYIVVKWDNGAGSEQVMVNVYSSDGKVIRECRFIGFSDQQVIKLGDLPSGTYYVSLIVNRKIIASEKFAIIK